MNQLSEETIKTFTEISNPKNADKFTTKSALEAFQIQRKSCHECKHHIKESGVSLCNAFSESKFCFVERLKYGKCKQEALLFEPKPIAKSKTCDIIAGIKEFFKKG